MAPSKRTSRRLMRRTRLSKIVLNNHDAKSDEDGEHQDVQSPPFRIGRMVDSIEFRVGECQEKTYTVEWEHQERHGNNTVADGSTPIESLKSPSEPEAVAIAIGSLPQRHMGVRVAKKFDSGVFLGQVTGVFEDGTETAAVLAEDYDGDVFYRIDYEDGDSEDFNHEELREGIALYSVVPKRRRRNYETKSNIVTPLRGGKFNRSSSFLPLYDKATPIHTLILGTHPGRNSLNENRYFSFPTNAFWWIAGDCLGFRRGTGEKKHGGDLMKLCANLRYDESHVIPYGDQVNVLCRSGFALWDVIANCNRQGSLDSAIKNDKPNDIREFVRNNPSIKNIVFANGKSGLALLHRHFWEWWKSGALVLQTTTEGDDVPNPSKEIGVINCICAPSVSPAAATMTYEYKRDFWDEFVYAPGLKLHQQFIEPLVGFTTSQPCFPKQLLNKGGRIGMYLPEARRHRIARFHVKRKMRCWRKKKCMRYDVRRKFAESRPRVKGQFIKKAHGDLVEL